MNSTSYGWLASRMPFSWENGILITNYPPPRLLGLDWDAADPDTWQSPIGTLRTLPLSMGPTPARKAPTTPFPTHSLTLLAHLLQRTSESSLWSTPAPRNHNKIWRLWVRMCNPNSGTKLFNVYLDSHSCRVWLTSYSSSPLPVCSLNWDFGTSTGSSVGSSQP